MSYQQAINDGLTAARHGKRLLARLQFEQAAEIAPDDLRATVLLAWAADSPDQSLQILKAIGSPARDDDLVKSYIAVLESIQGFVSTQDALLPETMSSDADGMVACEIDAGHPATVAEGEEPPRPEDAESQPQIAMVETFDSSDSEHPAGPDTATMENADSDGTDPKIPVALDQADIESPSLEDHATDVGLAGHYEVESDGAPADVMTEADIDDAADDEDSSAECASAHVDLPEAVSGELDEVDTIASDDEPTMHLGDHLEETPTVPVSGTLTPPSAPEDPAETECETPVDLPVDSLGADHSVDPDGQLEDSSHESDTDLSETIVEQVADLSADIAAETSRDDLPESDTTDESLSDDDTSATDNPIIMVVDDSPNGSQAGLDDATRRRL